MYTEAKAMAIFFVYLCKFDRLICVFLYSLQM